MPLFAGVWMANVDGVESDLLIGPAGADGVVTIGFPGALGNGKGFWNEASQRLAFTITLGPLETPFVGFFEGYLIRTPKSPAPGRDVALTLTGTVAVPFPTAGHPTHPALPTSRRSAFGWFATATEVN